MQEEAPVPPRRLSRLLARFTGASLVGFVVSFATMHLFLAAGLAGWAARLIALLAAMHVTFFLNGRFTFNALSRARFLPLWAAYVANSAVGNSFNYAVFLGLRAAHRPVISHADVAFVAGAVTAWAINFVGARFLVFGSLGQRIAARARALFVSPTARRSPPPAPAPAARGSSRR